MITLVFSPSRTLFYDLKYSFQENYVPEAPTILSLALIILSVKRWSQYTFSDKSSNKMYLPNFNPLCQYLLCPKKCVKDNELFIRENVNIVLR